MEEIWMKLLCCTGGGDEEVGGRGQGEAFGVVWSFSIWDLLCAQSASHRCCANGVVPLVPRFGGGHCSYLQVIKQFTPAITLANQLPMQINSMGHNGNEHLENTYSICNSRTKFAARFVQSATIPLLDSLLDSQLSRQKRKRKRARSCWRIVCMCVCVCTELGIALVPYSPLGHGFFAGYKPRAENQDSCSVCSLSSSNFPTLLSSACCLEFDV